MALGSPCEPWDIDLSCYELPEDLDAAIILRWQTVSTQILWALSGRRWGICPIEVRPCRRSCLDLWPIGLGVYSGHMVPYVHDGVWRNANVCGCGVTCSCGELCEVYLEGPVNAITEVTIDGAIVDPADYRVDAPGMLVRQNGECWPSCQDLSAPAGAEGTFVVTYELGLVPDEAAIAANSEYTYEFIKACVPDCGKCRLPRRVTQITQQGMAAQFIDPQDFMEKGRTGIYLVDQWLNAVNPNSLPAPSRVRSPDWRGPRTTLIP